MNETKLKLSVLLSKTEHLASKFKGAVKDYFGFFKSNQSAFKGEKKTYAPRSGTIDLPNERGNKIVVTTVKEKLDYMKENNSEYIDALFSQEATNASGTAKAELKLEGKSLGTFSSLELLRLKSLLENGEFEQMYAHIPVRDDAEEWNATENEQYKKREIFESEKQSYIKKSITKENYILTDPNIEKLKEGVSYTAITSTRDTILELGDVTYQKFSGEWSHRQRAELLGRRSKMLTAVIEALKNANDVESIKSNMTADVLFNFLHEGKLPE